MPAADVSVIVPAYRPLDYTTLRDSMAANADIDAEWIVVDDGSGSVYDATFAALADTPARVIRLVENRRQGAARNAGLAQARGAWIKFLDADDRLDAGHLAALVQAARAAPAGTIPFAPTRHVFPGGGTSVNDSWRDLTPDGPAQLARLLYAPFLHHCGALFPHALLTDLGGYDEALVTDEDGDLLIRILMTGARFAPVPEVEYHYIHHLGNGRVSSDTGGAKLAARLRVCDKVEAVFAGAAMPGPVRQGLARRLDRIALNYWDEDRVAALAVLERARRVCPGYQVSGRWPVRALRAFGGPGAAIAAARMARRLRGRPAGGTQA